jgi:AcrR family transcriptional regulator
MTHQLSHSDRRIARTHQAVFQAFAQLVTTRRYDEIKIADVVTAANIGRSTFYEHYTSLDDVLVKSLNGVQNVFADALVGKPDSQALSAICDHFWEKRALGRVILRAPILQTLSNRLAELVLERLLKDDSLAKAKAVFAAYGFWALFTEWLCGRVNTSPNAFADCLQDRQFQVLIGSDSDEES